MSSSAAVRTVSELEDAGVLLVQDGNHGEYRPRRGEIVDTGTPHIRAADIASDGSIDFAGAQRINAQALGRIRKGVGAPRDVLLTHKGTVGRVGRVPGDAPRFVCSPQTTFWRSLRPDVLDPGYLYAYLRSPLFLSQLNARMHESDMAPYVSLTAQRSLHVHVPPIAEQQTIAAVLGSIDDKIDSNERTARTLDACAELLAERWLLAQAPAVPVKDVAQVVLGGTPARSTESFWTNGTVSWVASGAVTDFRITTATALITEEALSKSAAKLLPAGTPVVAITGATCGEVSRLEIEACANQSVVGLVGGDRAPASVLLYWLRRSIPDLLRHATGAAQQHVNKGDVASLLYPDVAAEAAGHLAAQIDPLLELCARQLKEAQVLRAIRAELLPKLVGGKIRVSAAGEMRDVGSRETLGEAAA